MKLSSQISNSPLKRLSVLEYASTRKLLVSNKKSISRQTLTVNIVTGRFECRFQSPTFISVLDTNCKTLLARIYIGFNIYVYVYANTNAQTGIDYLFTDFHPMKSPDSKWRLLSIFNVYISPF